MSSEVDHLRCACGQPFETRGSLLQCTHCDAPCLVKTGCPSCAAQRHSIRVRKEGPSA